MDAVGLRSFRDLNPLSQADGTDQDEELGKTAFLELMIAQINNQDPLDPAKNEDFVAQLAQFSSVEGIQNLNESMADMASSIRAGLTLDAAGLVGRSVMAPTELLAFGGEPVTGAVTLDTSSQNVIVEVTHPSGELVRQIDLGPQQAGTLRFQWNGTSDAGAPVDAGVYRVRAYSEGGGDAQTYPVTLPDRVVSVSVANANAVANLASGKAVSISEISEIQ